MAYEVRFCSNCATELQWIVASEDSGEVQRLRCPVCGFTHWGNPTPVLAAVVEGDDGRVLLLEDMVEYAVYLQSVYEKDEVGA